MKIKSAILLTSSIFMPLAPSFAQEATAVETAHSNSGVGTGDIIVTAQRRSQSVMSVPLSIQASTGEQLSSAGIKDLTSLAFTTPGFLAATNSGFTQIYIRGVGNSIQTGADPSVATFVDDVPRIYGSMADNLVDVERVEVLKGAQGGLYGRNATGGVVNIITRSPHTDEVEGNFLVSYGEKNSFRASSYINLPLNDKIAMSLAVQRESRDAYVKNLAQTNPFTAEMFPDGARIPNATANPGVMLSPQEAADFFNADIRPQKLSNQDFWAVRGKLLFKLTDNFKLTVAGDYYKKEDTNGQGTVNITPAFTQTAIAGLYRARGINIVLPEGFIQEAGKFEASQGAYAAVNTREYGVSATAVWNLPSFDLTSITAYRNQSTYMTASSANATVNDVIVDINYPKKHFTYQEIRAVSSFGGPLRILGGATYLNNQLKGHSQNFQLSREFQQGNTKVNQKIENWSVYGEVGYDLTEQLSLTASGRYMREINTAVYTSPVFSEARSVQSAFVPSATLSYKLDGGNIYARYARGFKTGGVNLATAPFYFPRPEDGSIFGPETVDTYEIGYRQSLFDRTVQLTTAIFYNDYQDLQVNARGNASYPGITTAYVNAAGARTYGAEASINWRVSEPVTLGMNVGYLDAKFKDFAVTDSLVLAPFDRSGTIMPKAPKWQLSFNANLDQPLNNDIRLVGNAMVSHTSEVLYIQSARPGVLPDATVPAYWLANARLGIRTMDDKFGFAVVADNLFNTAYFTNANALALGNTRVWGSPRIVRGEISVKF